MTLHRFWLDGGYDRDLVEACRRHPDHEWRTLEMWEIDPDARWPRELFTFCNICGVPRCGESEVNGCDLPRHHDEDHRSRAGEVWPIGGTYPRYEPVKAPPGFWPHPSQVTG